MTEIDLDGPGAAKPRNKGLWLGAAAAVVLIAIVAVVLLVVLRGDSDSRVVRMEVTAEGTEVQLIVSGWARPGARELQMDSQGAVENGDVTVPWSRELEIPAEANTIALNVASMTPGQGTVTCRLLVDGKVRKEHSTATGAVCDVRAEEFFKQ